MRNVLTLLAAAALLSACGLKDPVSEAISAGNHLNDTIQKCIDHLKSAQSATPIPECNAMVEQAMYSKTKAKVTEPSAALDTIDQKTAQLRQEAASLMQKTAP